MRSITTLAIRLFLFGWMIHMGLLVFGQALIGSKFQKTHTKMDWRSHSLGWSQLNELLLVDCWLRTSTEKNNKGYFGIDNQLMNNENVYLTYSYELLRQKACAIIGVSMNNSSILSVKYNQQFSLASLLKPLAKR